MKTMKCLSMLLPLAFMACNGRGLAGGSSDKAAFGQGEAVDVTFEARHSNPDALFADELYACVNGQEQRIGDLEEMCLCLDAQQDFDGDGIVDALVRHVQACGGNAVGNSFFFVTYNREQGAFVVTDTFGSNVFDDPVVATADGWNVVQIVDTEVNEYTEEVEETPMNYVLYEKHAVRYATPSDITPMPACSIEEWREVEQRVDEMGYDVAISPRDSAILASSEIFDDLYSGHCSWYCGGEVQEVTASECHGPEGKTSYKAEYAHNFDHEQAWASEGTGRGEYLDYRFAGGCPRITTVKILNGDVQSEDAWQSHARTKLIEVFYRDKPYALLALEDSRTLQSFDIGVVGPHDPEAPDWTLRFLILDTYPTERHDYVVIPELYFSGIDVH